MVHHACHTKKGFGKMSILPVVYKKYKNIFFLLIHEMNLAGNDFILFSQRIISHTRSRRILTGMLSTTLS